MGMEHHGMERHGMSMGHHGMERNPCMQMIWEKADDEMKKKIRLRMLDERIMHKEGRTASGNSSTNLRR